MPKSTSTPPKPNLFHKIGLGTEKGRYIDFLEVSQPTSQVFIQGVLGGIARGFGTVLGATVVASFVLALLALVGSYVPGAAGEFVDRINETAAQKMLVK